MPFETSSNSLMEMVEQARLGNQTSWAAIVEEFTPLVASVARSHRLSNADALDVAQLVWLRLVEHLDRLRDIQSLPGWIAVTTRNACLDVVRREKRSTPMANFPEVRRSTDSHDPSEALIKHDEREAIREAFNHLGAACRELLAMCTIDPPLSYSQIGAALNMPVGSIGPTRSRCLETLRRKVANEF